MARSRPVSRHAIPAENEVVGAVVAEHQRKYAQQHRSANGQKGAHTQVSAASGN
jgi:hypothetical protein